MSWSAAVNRLWQKSDDLEVGLTTQVQWGVRYGDGQIEHCGDTPEDVLPFIESIRRSIADGTYEADDYEPMTVVVRTVQIEVTATTWADATSSAATP